MRQAHQRGARLVHFPEGALCSPHKRIVSSTGPGEVGPADWDRADWTALRAELTRTAELARELSLWTVLGSVHPLTPPNRPHNSLYVLSDRGELVTRYDERMLSRTKVSYLYAPGTGPVTFDRRRRAVRLRAGHGGRTTRSCSPSTSAWTWTACCSPRPVSPDGAVFATEAQAHAATNGFWVSFAVLAEHAGPAPAGLSGPDGRWLGRCPADGAPAVVVADLDESAQDLEVAVFMARPWRRTARSGAYDGHVVDDPRSLDRSTL